MGARGAIILGFFGALFAALTLNWHMRASGAQLAPPFVVFAMLAFAAVYSMHQPGRGVMPSAAARKAIKWSTIAEGAGLCLISNLVILMHRLDLLLPGMALVVGLHFLPIARAAAFRPFYLLGGTMVVSALVGFIVRAPSGGEIAGFTAATGLWAAAVMAIRRDLTARRSSVGTVGAQVA